MWCEGTSPVIAQYHKPIGRLVKSAARTELVLKHDGTSSDIQVEESHAFTRTSF